jgi:hypothetical protein
MDFANGDQLLCATPHNVAFAAEYRSRDEKKRYLFDHFPSGTGNRGPFAAASRSQGLVLCNLMHRDVVLDVVLHPVSRRAGNIATGVVLILVDRWMKASASPLSLLRDRQTADATIFWINLDSADRKCQRNPEPVDRNASEHQRQVGASERALSVGVAVIFGCLPSNSSMSHLRAELAIFVSGQTTGPLKRELQRPYGHLRMIFG